MLRIKGFMLVGLILVGCVGTDLIDDTNAILPARIVIEPKDAAVQIDSTMQFQATYYDTLGDVVPSAAFEWSSSDSEIAAISENGMAVGRSEGQVMIFARSGHVTSEPALLRVVANSNQVARIEVSPDSGMLAVGETLQFNANALNLNGDVIEGVVFSWRSTNPSVAEIDNAGVATAMTPGSTSIIATTDGVDSSPAILEVSGQSRSGSFTRRPGTSYNVSGTATLQRQTDGSLVLNFGSDFSSSNGPGLAVFLSKTNSVTSGSLNLGDLKSTSGAQSYDVPQNVQISTYDWVIIHCVPFNVTFGYAELENGGN